MPPTRHGGNRFGAQRYVSTADSAACTAHTDWPFFFFFVFLSLYLRRVNRSRTHTHARTQLHAHTPFVTAISPSGVCRVLSFFFFFKFLRLFRPTKFSSPPPSSFSPIPSVPPLYALRINRQAPSQPYAREPPDHVVLARLRRQTLAGLQVRDQSRHRRTRR